MVLNRDCTHNPVLSAKACFRQSAQSARSGWISASDQRKLLVMKRSAIRGKAVPIALGFIALAVLAARYCGYSDSVTKMRGLTLRQDLFTMRAIVDQFTLDRHRRPQSLNDLIAAGYLKHVPTDPMTGRNDTWKTRHHNWPLIGVFLFGRCYPQRSTEHHRGMAAAWMGA